MLFKKEKEVIEFILKHLDLVEDSLKTGINTVENYLENNIGEANVKGSARLHGEHISVRNVRFRTEEKGQVDLNGIEKHGSLETNQEGGTIRITETVAQR